MASLIPIISEILPILMPASPKVVSADSLQSSESTPTKPVSQRDAIVGQSDRLCASVITVRPHSSTSVRHNSSQDAIFYVVSGTGTLVLSQGFESSLSSHILSAGDFAFVPAWIEHQIRNDAEADLTCVMTQGGSHPERADLVDWGGDEAKA